jgi:hypothetical protein
MILDRIPINFMPFQVLFHSLPVMLERCVDYKLVGGGAEPIVIDQAVDFLQALLDLLTELHVHLEVCFPFPLVNNYYTTSNFTGDCPVLFKHIFLHQCIYAQFFIGPGSSASALSVLMRNSSKVWLQTLKLILTLECLVFP